MAKHHAKQLPKINKAIGIEAIQDQLSLRLLSEAERWTKAQYLSAIQGKRI